jgi:hypothetical protein
MAKARQFSDAATLISELASDDSNLGDAYITLCVHAGIAAADVVCCSRLGVHASGQDHAAAGGAARQSRRRSRKGTPQTAWAQDEGWLFLGSVKRRRPEGRRTGLNPACRCGIH